MRLLLALPLLLCAGAFAEQRPIRFAVTESSTMPLMRYEQGRAAGGILFDLQTRLAQKLQRRAELLVLPRMRVQQMMARGEIDVRCYVSPDWVEGAHHQYVWSVPFIQQRDLIVGRAEETEPPGRDGETIGTVLGFAYPRLQPLFADGSLRRDDARTQELALEKLDAGRYRYAVSNQLALDWHNRQRPPERRLKVFGEIASDPMACMVRDEGDVPTMQLLRALVRMKQDGEFETILDRYR
ncbi:MULTISPECIES: transporter substrate-binding domain-containing protein [unclassified Pseudomonas]|uniref:substrate-binding periplasmic protein n=1 Tax=unclassified Pseudomonas TaxID=196821 RepID=UPI00244876A4|nr:MULTISPECIES: transporter substrate-binding domain-containing protein [unclassified Pseudomonas]MDG9931258.1 ABC transporter substrate-binding protein [Pseudomonas sp. GD04042]MDH0484881.1 ABC transporter substrate-binding protein [Pseudomonas sp. GD04015]MDH0606959.1 ABC transporter substrate-binding protein [Pseudomonas sp. GD03869]